MKRLFILSILLVFLISCNTDTREYSVAITVVENSDIKYLDYPPHLATTKNITFTCEYKLVPSNDSIKIGHVKVYSTDPEIIEILNVDMDNYIITAITKKEGTAKIRVVTENYNSSTSLYIEVK